MFCLIILVYIVLDLWVFFFYDWECYDDLESPSFLNINHHWQNNQWRIWGSLGPVICFFKNNSLISVLFFIFFSSPPIPPVDSSFHCLSLSASTGLPVWIWIGEKCQFSLLLVSMPSNQIFQIYLFFFLFDSSLAMSTLPLPHTRLILITCLRGLFQQPLCFQSFPILTKFYISLSN